MHNFIVRILACFICNDTARRTFRKKYLNETLKDKICVLNKKVQILTTDIDVIKNKMISSDSDFIDDGKNNKVFIVYDDKHEEELTHPIDGLKIHINGNNNIIKIPACFGVKKSFLDINSDNLYLEIEPTIWFHNVWLRTYSGKNQQIHILHDTSFEQAQITVADEGRLYIGNDCMFSSGINIWAVDGHSIIDKNKNCTNYNSGHCLEIGNHIWVGENARITKNARRPHNSIIAASAVACRDYYTPEGGVIIAGNPGVVVKKDINWSRIQPYDYIKNRE